MVGGCAAPTPMNMKTVTSLPGEERPLFKKYLSNLSEQERLELFSDQQAIFEQQSKLVEKGNLPEARVVLEALINRELKVLPGINPVVTASRMKLLGIYRALGVDEKALSTAHDIVEAKAWILGGGAPDTADATVTLATVMAEQGQADEAETVLKNRLAVIENSGNNNAARILVLYSLGNFAQAAKRHNEARSLFREALKLKEAPQSYSGRSLHPLASEIVERLK